MLGYEDGRLRMTLGDHGVPLLLRVSRYCPKKGDGPEAKDRIRAELLQSGKRVFAREIAYGELEAAQGIMELFLTPLYLPGPAAAGGRGPQYPFHHNIGGGPVSRDHGSIQKWRKII